jgi:RHS repeat-associated protein
MAAVLHSPTDSTLMAYDANEQLGLIYKTASQVRFEYSGQNLTVERDWDGNILRRYVYGPGDDNPIVWYEGSGLTDKRYMMSDERGSITSITNASGALLGINRYDEYGIPASTNIGRFGYTGQTWLPEIGMNYYKARIYSPTLGRFMQTDPIGYGDGMNMYNYVSSDPVNNTDPSGLLQVIERCTGGGGGIDYVNGQQVTTVIGRVCSYSSGGGYDGYRDRGGGGGGGRGIIPDGEVLVVVGNPNCPVPTGGAGRNEINRNIATSQNVRNNTRNLWVGGYGVVSGVRGVWFKSKVQTGGAWDYKNLHYPRGQGLKYPNGQDYGNFNYGATAAALGFTNIEIYLAADLYSLVQNGTTEKEDQQIANGIAYYRNNCGAD